MIVERMNHFFKRPLQFEPRILTPTRYHEEKKHPSIIFHNFLPQTFVLIDVKRCSTVFSNNIHTFYLNVTYYSVITLKIERYSKKYIQYYTPTIQQLRKK